MPTLAFKRPWAVWPWPKRPPRPSALLGMVLAPLAALELTGRLSLAAIPMTISLLSNALVAATVAPALRVLVK